jgi:hypothetical protein
MKFKNAVTVFVVTLLVGVTYKAQTIDPQYEVGTWQGFKSSAVSFTFDDNTPNQLSVIVPMFDQYGFKVTLFTVINWGPNWSGLQTAATKGHEIASHTMSHAIMNTLTNDQQATDYKNSQDAINAKITAQKCVTIAYPNCVVGNSTVCKQYYVAARGCSGQIEPKTPSDFMNISSIVCGSQGSMKTASDFTGKVDAAASTKGWVVFLLHAVDTESGYSPTSSTEIKGVLDYMSQNKSKFWVTSFGNAARYIKERNNVSVKEISVNDSVITFSVTDTLNNSIYDFPVTFRRVLLEGWASAKISQNGKVINSEIVDVNSKRYVMFDVAPDGGDIQMTKAKTTDVSENDNSLITTPFLMQNYPNPFNPSTTIKYAIPIVDAKFAPTAHVSIKIYDMLGREVATLVDEFKHPGNYSVSFSTYDYNFSSGVYFYTLRAGNFSQTKKFVLIK